MGRGLKLYYPSLKDAEQTAAIRIPSLHVSSGKHGNLRSQFPQAMGSKKHSL